MPQVILILLLAIMGGVFSLIHYYSPHIGDDMGYGYAISEFSEKFNGNKFFTWIYYCIRHWFFSNGRMANYIATFILNGWPQWLIAIINGAMWSMLGFIVLQLTDCFRNNFIFSFFILGFIWLALPWWDSGLLTDVALNYSYSAVFGLTFIWIFLHKNVDNRLGKIIIIIFALIAGMMHEAMSFPLICGILVFYYLRTTYSSTRKKLSWHNLNPFKRQAFTAFTIGCLAVLLSPGIWLRFFRVSNRVPDDPMPLLLLKSDFLVLLLIAVIIIFKFYKKDSLNKLINSNWIIFATAAVISAMFSAVSGIVGRSGWFAQIYSLIALVLMLKTLNFKVGKYHLILAGSCLSIIILFCYGSVLLWQIKRGKEYVEAIKLYKLSENGVVYLDHTDDREVPFFTLGITNGVPDADDLYSLYMLQKYEGKGKPFVILPKDLQSWDGSIGNNDIKMGKGYVTSIDPTQDKIKYMEGEEEEQELRLVSRKEGYYTVIPFLKNGKTFYYVSPLDLDFGDRLVISDN